MCVCHSPHPAIQQTPQGTDQRVVPILLLALSLASDIFLAVDAITTGTQEDYGVATLTLKADQLRKFRSLRDDLKTDSELARRMQMDPGQVSRVLRGAAPGERFIAGLLSVFGVDFFADLFEVVTPEAEQ